MSGFNLLAQFFPVRFPDWCDYNGGRVEREDPQKVTLFPRHIIDRHEASVGIPECRGCAEATGPLVEDLPTFVTKREYFARFTQIARFALLPPKLEIPVG